MDSIYWLIIFIVLLGVEMISLGLTTVWFAGGALVAFIANLAGAGLGVQIVLFFAVSIVLLVLTRPLALKYFNKDRTKTNAESLVGKKARVIEPIDNISAKGKVEIGGMEWTARSEKDETAIQMDKIVTVVKISGVKLIVKETEE